MKIRLMFITAGLSVALASCTHFSPEDVMKEQPDAQTIANALDLSGHIEGGYYRRTYQADHRDMVNTASGDRFLMTSIYYMLTSQSPIGHFHLNKSDIMHYFHMGDPIHYTLIHPDGQLDTVIMGNEVTKGQLLQLHVKGGTWKASQLLEGDYGYGLISEAVSPGFDFADMTIGVKENLVKQFPQHAPVFEGMTKE